MGEKTKSNPIQYKTLDHLLIVFSHRILIQWQYLLDKALNDLKGKHHENGVVQKNHMDKMF